MGNDRQRAKRRRNGQGNWKLIRYADLCRPRHKSAYAEDRVMPTRVLDGLPCGQVVIMGAA
jgi:hypothetical protein